MNPRIIRIVIFVGMLLAIAWRVANASEKPGFCLFKDGAVFVDLPDQTKIKGDGTGNACLIDPASGLQSDGSYRLSWELRKCDGTDPEHHLSTRYGFIELTGETAMKISLNTGAGPQMMWVYSPFVTGTVELQNDTIVEKTTAIKETVDETNSTVEQMRDALDKTNTGISDLKTKADKEKTRDEEEAKRDEDMSLQLRITACETRVLAVNEMIREHGYRAADSCTAESGGLYLPIANTITRLIRNNDTGGAAPSAKDYDEQSLATAGISKFRKCDNRANVKQIDTKICQINPDFNALAPIPPAR